MKARLEPKRVKGKTSCRTIQEELNDNPYLYVEMTRIISTSSSSGSLLLPFFSDLRPSIPLLFICLQAFI